MRLVYTVFVKSVVVAIEKTPPSCIITVLAYTSSDFGDSIKYSCRHLLNYYLPNRFFFFKSLQFFKTVFPFQSTSWAVPQEWNNDALAVQRACSENAELLQSATPCICVVCLSVRLFITLKGVQVGFESQDAGVGKVGGSVEV